jgi:hypothetical protein
VELVGRPFQRDNGTNSLSQRSAEGPVRVRRSGSDFFEGNLVAFVALKATNPQSTTRYGPSLRQSDQRLSGALFSSNQAALLAYIFKTAGSVSDESFRCMKLRVFALSVENWYASHIA